MKAKEIVKIMKQKRLCLKKKEMFTNKNELALFENCLTRESNKGIMYRVVQSLPDCPSQMLTA